ncbi:SDR family NAD(P)-dependent oxidoreductase [Phyllobacterium sp. LjRoot231]|uniref:SDR family NAD(P)-dependent oxidoreductase n=1 Tax=Phyllobacterium sp. LjRoot231 TaxID=3342289 RepID=UPI003ED142BC
MTTPLRYRTALIVGAGTGLSASLCRVLAAEGIKVGLAARNTSKLEALAAQVDADTFTVDASNPEDVMQLFEQVDGQIGAPDIVIYNASARLPGRLTDLDPEAVHKAIDISAYGGFLVAQQAAKRMLVNRHGALFFTGATASVKGFAHSAAFSMGKFALRGLAQSAARELAPQGIHVAHVVIDGGIRSAARPDPVDRMDSTLDPDAIAETYLALLRQPRNAWSWEIEVRPWVETF